MVPGKSAISIRLEMINARTHAHIQRKVVCLFSFMNHAILKLNTFLLVKYPDKCNL